MVTVTHLLFAIPLFVQGAFARAADPKTPEVDYGAPTGAVYPDYFYTTDYGKPAAAYFDYTADYGKPSAAYVDYTADYGKPSSVYDYYNSLYDYGYNEYDYYHYYQDYSLYDDEYLHEYGEYFGYGDRNNPLDTALGVYESAGVPSDVPWIYIIVPVLQVDLYYVDDEQKGIENIDMEPIETFLFELGDFGLGHLQLGDFGLGELQWDDHVYSDYGAYDYLPPAYEFAYEDFPVYGNYPHGAVKPQLFDYAEQLDDGATLDYPAVDYQPLWMDWIFMVPPDNLLPVEPAMVR